MRAYTKSYAAAERIHLVEGWDALVRLVMRAAQSGVPVLRLELTQGEASQLMGQLGEQQIDEWVHFSTLLGVPFTIVEAETLSYAI